MKNKRRFFVPILCFCVCFFMANAVGCALKGRSSSSDAESVWSDENVDNGGWT